jgi:Kdo2-lipid IVA lauroyltransferase/acyltransferase
MYYILYGLLYFISLLPFFIIYRISDFFFVLLYYVFGYRKKVVVQNIAIAFPEKTAGEHKKIARQFYRNLVDTFIETIKMLSMSDRQFSKRCTTDMSAVNALVAKGHNIQIHAGHQMNWEYANWVVSRGLTLPWIGIYQPIGNKSFNKVFLKLRARYHTKLVSTREFKTAMPQLFKSQYVLGLAADQNTSPQTGYWMYFFSQPVPFIMGPDKGALKNNTAVVFTKSTILKRGHYHFEHVVVAESTENYKPGELTRLYRDFLETIIRQQPHNYLWTHRRWRHKYSQEFSDAWFDNRPAPVN